ncbi:hypothetical protein LCGC14_2248170 [marine sediment metagenome]|uniref:Phage head-tail adaptor n=1 Tax=marine sediment metagenome TaxID=412755 RepID=A0A0F9DQU0_9ZZZZ
MSFVALLDNTCNIIRQALVEDGQGGWTDSDVIIYRRIACRFETLTTRMQVMAYDKTMVFPDYYFYMEFLSGIREGDRIVFESRKFEIKLIEDWSERKIYHKLAVTEVYRGE